MIPRIILAYPGGELTLFRYKRAIPDYQVIEKLGVMAHSMFDSWEWGDGIPAIVSGNVILMAVYGSSAEVPYL